MGDGLYVSLGKQVRLCREKAQLTQGELARRVGMTRTSITNIETGRQKVQLHTLYQVARAVNVSPQDLLPPIQIQDEDPQAFENQLPPDVTPEEREWTRRLLTGQSA